jgi:hypothetical protein
MFTLDFDIELSILRERIGKYTMIGAENDRRFEKQNTKGRDAV